MSHQIDAHGDHISSQTQPRTVGLVGRDSTTPWVASQVAEQPDTKYLSGSLDEVPNGSSSIYSSTSDLPLLAERQGDVISSHKALLTLAKGFVGTGCLSLPYAFKLGGLWILFSGAQDHRWTMGTLQRKCLILAVSSTSRSIVGKACMWSTLRCYYINWAVLAFLLYLLVQISTSVTMSTTFYATVMLIPLLGANMLATMNSISYLAIAATVLWLFGAVSMLQECFRMPNQWNRLPAYTDWWSTVMFFGTAMYSYEGQTMILPVENSMRYPEDFTANCGVLPTLMISVTVLYNSLGFYGYTAYGEDTASTLPLNMPNTTLFAVVSVMLILMAFLAHPINLYVVFDMFWPGFKRKFSNKFPYWRERTKTLDTLFRTFWVLMTYFLAVFVPRIEQIVSLVGITGGSLCAFVYPPILEILTFRIMWALKCSTGYVIFKMIINISLIILGILLCFLGLYVNVVEIYKSF